jgi:hypothetical protein
MVTCVLKSPNSVEIALIFQKTSKLSQKYMSPLCEKLPKKRNTLQLGSKVQGFFFQFCGRLVGEAEWGKKKTKGRAVWDHEEWSEWQ